MAGIANTICISKFYSFISSSHMKWQNFSYFKKLTASAITGELNIKDMTRENHEIQIKVAYYGWENMKNEEIHNHYLNCIIFWYF